MPRIDLNIDLGEGGQHDTELMGFASSVHIACGGHAGDASSMRLALRVAQEQGVAVGAHPSFQDREHFGRRRLDVSPSQIEDDVCRQLEAIAEIAEELGAVLRHVKPHGALYHAAATDADVAAAVCRAVAKVNPRAILFGHAGSLFLDVARKAGFTIASEVFADRAYTDEARLVTRTEAGAVITDSTVVARRALQLARRDPIEAITGKTLTLSADTICLHGDTPGAPALARLVRNQLEENGVEIAPPGNSNDT